MGSLRLLGVSVSLVGTLFTIIGCTLQDTATAIILLFLMQLSLGGSGPCDILFVSDSGTDLNIASVLSSDDHRVTIIKNDYDSNSNITPSLMEDLSAFDAVFWSATGSGYGSQHTQAAFQNLEPYVQNGGYVFVTGYDSLADDTLMTLSQFVASTKNSNDNTGAAGNPMSAIADAENSLTVGLFDIRGVVPSGGDDDRDGLTKLGGDTIGLVKNLSRNNYEWTLRTIGLGNIAYVSNGNKLPDGNGHPSWKTESTSGAGAYNAALRNFAHNSCNRE
jgi:hypothetical protein